jgi:hypothetical protein
MWLAFVHRFTSVANFGRYCEPPLEVIRIVPRR